MQEMLTARDQFCRVRRDACENLGIVSRQFRDEQRELCDLPFRRYHLFTITSDKSVATSNSFFVNGVYERFINPDTTANPIYMPNCLVRS